MGIRIGRGFPRRPGNRKKLEGREEGEDKEEGEGRESSGMSKRVWKAQRGEGAGEGRVCARPSEGGGCGEAVERSADEEVSHN